MDIYINLEKYHDALLRASLIARAALMAEWPAFILFCSMFLTTVVDPGFELPRCN